MHYNTLLVPVYLLYPSVVVCCDIWTRFLFNFVFGGSIPIPDVRRLAWCKPYFKEHHVFQAADKEIVNCESSNAILLIVEKTSTLKFWRLVGQDCPVSQAQAPTSHSSQHHGSFFPYSSPSGWSFHCLLLLAVSHHDYTTKQTIYKPCPPLHLHMQQRKRIQHYQSQRNPNFHKPPITTRKNNQIIPTRFHHSTSYNCF